MTQAAGISVCMGNGSERLKQLCDRIAVRSQTGTCVSDKNHHIGFGNSRFSLVGHFADNPFRLYGFKTARVHDNVWTGAHTPLTVLPISGQAREVGHDRVAAAGQTVKERRLADIRTSDESDNRKHKNRSCGYLVTVM